MSLQNTYQTFSENGYTGALLDALSEVEVLRMRELVDSPVAVTLAEGRHKVVSLPLLYGGESVLVAVKRFGRQSRLKDFSDKKRGSKAARSFLAAQRLHERGVGTPEPLGYLDKWVGGKLKESYFLSLYAGELSDMRIELDRLYAESPDAHLMVELVSQAASFIRKMHDAGFLHKDLGVQNIMLRRDGDHSWKDLQVIDLNRGRVRDTLTLAERARDMDRLDFPGAFMDVFLGEYWQGAAPEGFWKMVQKARAVFDRHVVTRNLRRPKLWGTRSTWHQRHRNIWLWDERSAQAAIVMSRSERKRCYPKGRVRKTLGAGLKHAPAAWKRYKELLPQAYSQPVEMQGRLGMSLECTGMDLGKQGELMKPLGQIPLLVRFAHHESEEQWQVNAETVKRLHGEGHEIMLALLQDRKAVLQPEKWEAFLFSVMEMTAGYVNRVEVCHAVNRTKWGVWSAAEQAVLLKPLLTLQEKYPEVSFMGPACIDFEYHYVLTALDQLPEGLKLDALSHHLYVDRRGAPENFQGNFSLLEKAALLKAIAETMPTVGDEVIVSEVNWPVEGAGTWSPVDATYLPEWGSPSKLGVTDALNGAYMLRYYVIALCSGMVEQVYWWRLVSHGFGLVDERADGGWRERVGYTMLRTFLDLLGQGTFIEKLPSSDQVYLLKFKTSKGEVIMGWANGIEHAHNVLATAAVNARGEEVSVDSVLTDEPLYFLLAE